MKFRVFVAVLCLVLSAAILLLLPTGFSPQTQPSTNPSLQLPTPPYKPTLPPEPGVVRIYCCNGQWLQVLDTLAAQYTSLYGTQVVLLQPEQDSCEATLQQLMAGEEAPGMLCLHSADQLLSWRESLLDLGDTALAAGLISADFGLYADDQLLAIPVDLEAFGLLCNAEVLSVALSRSDIYDLSSLSTAAQILKSNSTKAFPCTSLDTKDLLQLGITEDPAALRAFLDLYVANTHTSGQTLDRFLDGQCAFYLGGTWDYDLLTADPTRALQARNLDILPTFSASALQYTFSTAWCVNAGIRQEDLDATLQFLAWLVTSGEDGSAPVDSLQMLTPFADAAWYGTYLEKKVLGYMRSEPAALQWLQQGKESIPLSLALQGYINNPSDRNWSNVESNMSLPKTE